MDQYRNQIAEEIAKLSIKGKVLFGVLTSDLLYPNYVAFEKRYSWGDHDILQDAIFSIFQYTINNKLFSSLELKNILTEVELVTPDTNDFPGILTSFALDACTSVISTLQFIADKNEQHIIDVSTYARDTVDMFIQEKEYITSLDSSIEIQIEHDDFMVEEKKRQKKLISDLASSNLEKITDNLIERLRASRPIIDLSLLPKS